MNTKMFLLSLVITVLLISACQTRSTKIVTIRYAEEDTVTHVKFRATIITGEESKNVEGETPYKIEFTDQSYVVLAYPQADSVNLFMESWDKNATASRVKGWAHSGTIFYVKPNGGPGYVAGR